MDTVIYTASPLKAFSGSLFVIVFFFVLAGVGIATALFSKKQGKIARIVTGVASVILLLAGFVSVIVTTQSYLAGDKTVTVHVDKKRELTRSCDNGNRKCVDYTAETSDGQKYYVFNLNKPVWEKIEVNACYQFTYYPSKSLLGEYLQQDNPYKDLYETTGSITRIAAVKCP